MKKKFILFLLLFFSVTFLSDLDVQAKHYSGDDTVAFDLISQKDTFSPGATITGVTSTTIVKFWAVNGSSGESAISFENDLTMESSYEGDKGVFGLADGQVWGIVSITYPPGMTYIHFHPVTAPHIHSFATEWTTNETHHWHECTATGATDSCKSNGGSYGSHIWNAVTGKCSTCGYSCTHNGATTGYCSICGYYFEHRIAVTSNGNGSASASPDFASPGSAIFVEVTPDDGYEFDYWECDGIDSLTGDSFNMPDNDVTLKAYFKAIVLPPTPDPDPAPTPEPKPDENEIAEQRETSLPINIVRDDKTEVKTEDEEEVAPEIYNFSTMTTKKGMIYGLEKMIEISNDKVRTDVLSTKREESVGFYTGSPVTFDKDYLSIFKNSEVDIIYYFRHNGHLYRVTIPKGCDLSNVLEEGGYSGPLYVGKILGTSELIK